MKTIAALVAAATFGGGVVYLANPPVELQPTIPGTPQTGNLSITGRAKAGYVEAYSTAPTGIAYGGDFRTVSNQGRGVLGNASSPTGVTYGGLFQAASTSGRAVSGVSSATSGFSVGGFFTANSTDGKGVQGNSNADSGLNYGVYGRNLSPTGFGLYSEGHVGLTKNLAIGLGTDVASTRLKIQDDDVDFSEASVQVINGVHEAFGVGRGALFAESGGSGVGVASAGYAHSTTDNAYGLYGSAKSPTLAYGVFGTASGTGTNYSGYFTGLLYASSASSGVKAFMIDHPLDPANKVLYHSSIESDERMNVYRGEVRTDENGFATVTLPNWFSAVNENELFQLTVIDDANSADFVLAKVVQRVKNGKFKIRTSKPGVSVSWMVTGRRHDPTSNAYPFEVERMKTKEERGKYYEPSAYGKDPSLGMGYLSGQPSQVRTPQK